MRQEPEIMTLQADVFEIERYAVEDGPGIRSVVFFKGCNLRCLWCQNPESHEAHPQVLYYRSECISCRRCLGACPKGAVMDSPVYRFVTDQTKCRLHGACVEACYAGARKIVGRKMTVDEIMNSLERDVQFFRESGGGVTFSGGEPLLQAEAVAELARRCRTENVHTALETAGSVPWATMQGILPLINLVYFDLKHIDPSLHRKYTGAALEPILDNLRHASAAAERFIVRIPVVPGINADGQVMRRMFEFLRNETSAGEVELLPFHRLGLGKYDALGRSYAMGQTGNLSVSDCEPFVVMGRDMGLTVRAGAGGR
jgi:pyruvate formate lyase activating enzyme